MKASLVKCSCNILPWISWKTYLLGSRLCTLVYHQQMEKYYLLDGNAALAWDKVSKCGEIARCELHELALLESEHVIEADGRVQVHESSGNTKCYDALPRGFCEAIKREGYVFDVHWDLTNKCNSRCIHCYNSHSHDGLRNDNAFDELTFGQAIELVDCLDYLGVFRIVLSGGEAMTKEYFFDLCRYIRSKHIALIIYTNGLLLTDSNVRKLAELQPASVCVSSYGPCGEVHDKVSSVKGSYAMVVAGLARLKKCSIKTCHKNTLLKPNYKYWRETFDKGCAISDNSMINATIYPSMDDGSVTQYALTEEQLLELALQPGSPLDFRKQLRGVCNIAKGDFCSPCYDETNQLYISPNGDVYPCIAAPYKLANVKVDDIKPLKRYVVNSNFNAECDDTDMVGRLDNWRSLKISDLKECGKYDYCQFCVDVCPGDAYVMCGDYLAAPMNHCVIAKARHKASLIEKNA